MNATSISDPRQRRVLHAIVTIAVVAMVAVVAVGCSGSDQGPSSSLPEGALSVVVSDRPLADLVARVAGPEVAVTSVVPMGANGHTYEPRPEDARTLAKADVYIENGMGLNTVVSSFARSNYPTGTPHYALADVIPPREVLATDTPEQIAAHGHAHSFNAHFWPDPVYAAAYVNRIAEIMAKADPDGAAGYQERAAALVAKLKSLDVAFAAAIATIPEANRKMVVYHDSWSYFGRRYGLPVIGAIQPTDFSEPSAAELRRTIDQVRAARVPAFFGSEVFPSGVLKVIQEESGATYVADLSDDALPGNPGDPQHSYVGMMVANVRTIVTALGGNASGLDAVDPARS
jgi:ABC-type Zn uptake system ZnuABC Zn-binding protein ZnuA